VVAAKPVEPVVDASTLAAEEALLEQARTQLSSGHAEAALDAVHTHAQRYPDGALREEREALMTLALARSGDVAAARVHATEFVARHPRSLFRPVVEPLSH
jgi:outer membrane protein assembly factor BamD (BamD/ComL family)